MEVSSHEDSASELCRVYFFNEVVEVGQYGKGCGQYIPALTSDSVNESIIQSFK